MWRNWGQRVSLPVETILMPETFHFPNETHREKKNCSLRLSSWFLQPFSSLPLQDLSLRFFTNPLHIPAVFNRSSKRAQVFWFYIEKNFFLITSLILSLGKYGRRKIYLWWASDRNVNAKPKSACSQVTSYVYLVLSDSFGLYLFCEIMHSNFAPLCASIFPNSLLLLLKKLAKFPRYAARQALNFLENSFLNFRFKLSEKKRKEKFKPAFSSPPCPKPNFDPNSV